MRAGDLPGIYAWELGQWAKHEDLKPLEHRPNPTRPMPDGGSLRAPCAPTLDDDSPEQKRRKRLGDEYRITPRKLKRNRKRNRRVVISESVPPSWSLSESRIQMLRDEQARLADIYASQQGVSDG